MTAKYNALAYSLWLFTLSYYNPAAFFVPLTIILDLVCALHALIHTFLWLKLIRIASMPTILIH